MTISIIVYNSKLHDYKYINITHKVEHLNPRQYDNELYVPFSFNMGHEGKALTEDQSSIKQNGVGIVMLI